MAAIILLTIAIGSMLPLLIQVIQMGQDVDRTYVAINLCKNRLEEARRMRSDYGYDSISLMAESDTIINREGTADPDGDYSRTTVIDDSYDTNVTKVTVTVKYKRSGLFTSPSIELVTLVCAHT